MSWRCLLLCKHLSLHSIHGGSRVFVTSYVVCAGGVCLLFCKHLGERNMLGI